MHLSSYCFAVRALSALVIIAALVASPLAYPQDGALQLSASVDKPRYAMGEPVYLSVLLRNSGKAPLQVPEQLNPKFESIEVTVTNPEGKTVSFTPLSALDSDELPTPLSAGQVRGEVFPIFFGARGWTFQKSGKYRVDARYASAETRREKVNVIAKPIMLEITEDKAGELLMSQKRASEEAGKFLVWHAGDHLRVGMALLEQLLEQHPASPVANYVRLAFGRSQVRFFRDYPAERVRMPDHRKAEQFLNKVNPAALPPYLRAQFELSQAKVDVASKRQASAQKRVSEVRKMIKERPELRLLNDPALRIERAIG